MSLAAAEVAVRLIYEDKFGSRPGFYISDDVLGWKPNANLDHTFHGPDFRIEIRTDVDGYRLGALGEIDYRRPLVVLCGDSYTFGWGVSTHDSYASFVDEMLNAYSKGELRTVNLGVGGYGILQSCDRLIDFFNRHAESRVGLIVLQHAVNDATDNYSAIGYHLRLWKAEDRIASRSRSHLLNACRYAMAATPGGRRAAADSTRLAYEQDLLWAYRRTGTLLYPTRVTIGDRKLTFDTSTLRSDFSPDSLIARRALSGIQRELMFESLNCFHAVAHLHNVTVVHSFISTTPDWYVQEVAGIARRSADFSGCRAVITRALPQPEEYSGPTNNAHSGGHFNPAFNRYWAATMVEFLEAADLLPRS